MGTRMHSDGESNVLIGIMVVAVFLIIALFGVFVTINALNTSNIQAGNTLYGNGNETLYGVVLSPQNLTAPIGATCVINSVTVHGWTVPPSNYTVNGCEVTYTPE